MKNILLIDKEVGWTSFDVVAKIRGQLTGTRSQDKEQTTSGKRQKIKVGHAGTLDPFATGLLIVLVGKEGTKRQDEFMKLDKEYEAVLELGKISTTGDPEGRIEEFDPCHPEQSEGSKSLSRRDGDSSSQAPQNDTIVNVLKIFIGEIEQVPPKHSAIKINGKRAYDLARKGEEFEMKPRKVTIYDIKIIDYSWPSLALRVHCGSGTYIRSLAQDIGEKLGIGAYLTELRRTKIGPYDIKDAKKVSALTNYK